MYTVFARNRANAKPCKVSLMKISILVAGILLIWISGCRDSAEQPLMGVNSPASTPSTAMVPAEDALGTVVVIVKDPNESEPHRAAKVTVRKRSQ
jgi:hypothetical protein